MIQVYVNADDFSLDENRTKAILQAYEEGWISTTSAMVNMPWFERSLEFAKGTGIYDNIGLHLNLTEGHPLTEKIKKSPLFCNPDGTFNAVFHHSKNYRLYLPYFEREAVAEEISAQLKKYADSGLKSFHLDSHHHVHTDYSIARILLPMAKMTGFKRIRLSRNFGSGLNVMKRVYKFILNQKLSRNIPPISAYFCNFEDFHNHWSCLKDGTSIEIMTHPLFSTNHEPDLQGDLTEFHWDRTVQKEFWKNVPEQIKLCDYSSGSL